MFLYFVGMTIVYESLFVVVQMKPTGWSSAEHKLMKEKGGGVFNYSRKIRGGRDQPVAYQLSEIHALVRTYTVRY